MRNNKKERKQDLSMPEDEAIESKVMEMMDISEPDVTVADELVDEAQEPKGIVLPSKKIIVKDDNESTPGAPTLPTKSKTLKKQNVAKKSDDKKLDDLDKELDIAVKEASQQLAEKKGQASLDTVDETVVLEKPEAEPEANKTDSKSELLPEANIGMTSSLDSMIDSETTNSAVKEIIANESDQLLAVQDEGIQNTAVKIKPKRKKPIKKRILKILIGVLFLALLASLASPSIRYKLLNTAGVRSGASIVIVDSKTLQPIKGVSVTIGNSTATTDSSGTAKLDKLLLGPTELRAEKRAYKTITRHETLGWGSNPLVGAQLEPIGVKQSFLVVDELSGKPIKDSEIISGEFSVRTDEKGEAVLNSDAKKGSSTKVTIQANGYRSQDINASTNDGKPIQVKLLLSQRIAFVVRGVGTYDIYAIDSDGRNKKQVLKGTGHEQSNLKLIQSPDGNRAMLIANRTGSKDKNGALVEELNIINIDTGEIKEVSKGSAIKPIGWAGKRFIYTRTINDVNSDDPARDRLMSYDYNSGDNRQLASSNYFNEVMLVGTTVFYSPSSAHQDGVNVGFFRVNANGDNKQLVLDKEVWGVIRTSYDSMALAVQQDWYQLKTSDQKPVLMGGKPVDSVSRVYSDSPDGLASVWVDEKGGKSKIQVLDIKNNKETTVVDSLPSVSLPRWIGNSSISYGAYDRSEFSIFIVSTNGGEPRKLTSAYSSSNN